MSGSAASIAPQSVRPFGGAPIATLRQPRGKPAVQFGSANCPAINLKPPKTHADYDLSSVSFRAPDISDAPEVVFWSFHRSPIYNPNAHGKDFFFAPASGPVVQALGKPIELATEQELVNVLPDAMGTATEVILNGGGWNVAAVDANGTLIGVVRIKEFDHTPWSLHDMQTSLGKKYCVVKHNSESLGGGTNTKKAVPTFEISYFIAPLLISQTAQGILPNQTETEPNGFTGVGSGIVARLVSLHAERLATPSHQKRLKSACYMATVARDNARSKNILAGLGMELAQNGDIPSDYVDPAGRQADRLMYATQFDIVRRKTAERLSQPRFKIYADGSLAF
jgi:hypothetical protein